MSNISCITLDRLPPGKSGVVCDLNAVGITRRRLLDLGFVPGTVIECVRKSPSGDPTAYRTRGAVIALRSEEGAKIIIQPL